MPVPCRWLVAACAMTLPYCAGCLAPNSYSPYGNPYGYPGAYPQPGPTFPGGVQSVPSGTYAPTPNGSSAANSGNTDAPMFDPNAKDPNPVPNYPDPGDLGAPPKTNDKNMFDQNKSPFDMGRNDRSRNNSPRSRYDAELATNPAEPPILKLSAEENSPPAEAPAPSLGTATEPDAFLPPQQSFADADELKVPYEEDSVEIPFGYDTQKYLYLRGLVNYDDRSETWSIIYDNQPDRDDEYGGVFTLLDHPGFAALNNNDVVYVEGKVSADQNDEYGKPKYHVEKLTKLQRTPR